MSSDGTGGRPPADHGQDSARSPSPPGPPSGLTADEGAGAWHRVWERKGACAVAQYDLPTLLAMDGYDTGAGALAPDAFESIVDVVRTELGLRSGIRLLDVGCGAGALLWCLQGDGLDLYGIDSSPSLIDHAEAAVPRGKFAVAEAVETPFTADAVVCCSVFHYFPDHAYARRAIEALLRAAPVALVMDVPDAARRREAEAVRLATGSKPGRHLYYSRSFFEPARVWTNQTPGYANAPFRFHALLRRADR